MGLTNHTVREAVLGRGAPDNPELLSLLTSLQERTQAAIVYVLDRKGTVVGSSRYGDGKFLTGKNYGFRPYFTGAMSGRDVIYPAVGVTTNQRGLYYSSPVMNNGPGEADSVPAGVITFKMGLERLDSILADVKCPVSLVSPDGLVFSTNQAPLLFTSFKPVEAERLAALRKSRQFGNLYQDGRIQVVLSALAEAQVTYQGHPHVVTQQGVSLGGKELQWQLVFMENRADWYPTLTAVALSTGILAFSLIAGLYLNTAIHRQRLEKEKADVLHRSNETYLSIFNAADDAILVHEVDTGKVLDCNRRAQECWGYSLAEMLSLPIQELTAADDKGGIREDHWSLSNLDQIHQNFEWRIRSKDGESFLFDVNLHHCMIDGVPRMLSVCRDITHRRQIEQDLIRSERLAAVGTLASGVAHEFNNINCIIKGFADLMLETEDLSPEAQSYMKRIQKSSARASQITGSLLSFTGKRKKSSASTNLVEIIEDTLALVGRELEKEGVTVRTDLAPIPDTHCDPSELGQVILNMIINARHAMLGVESPCLTLKALEGKGEIRIDIQDNGCGISEENLQQIFLPFFSTKGEHAPGSNQSTLKGTGLGLSVSHSIISATGGRIMVESTLGQGTTFSLYLPIQADAQTDAEGGETPTHSALILDTDPDTRSLIGAVLEPEGFVIGPLQTLTDAIPLFAQDHIDLAFVDHEALVDLTPQSLADLQEGLDKHNSYLVEITTFSDGQNGQGSELANRTIYKPFSLHEIKSAAARAQERAGA
jgi:PAS domain S-box-containing protein